ncbi:hypothetical protein V498_10193 [Pseudogymnoascus sp. VKM F-4517 (FW-2822)]|nr:hypothetical protein V498_10193 [Pseudogymnoascus sp. VKM F-4517 (FW-2822)]
MATTVESDVDLEGLSDVEVTMDFTSFTNPKDFSKTLQDFFNNARDREPTGDHTALVTRYPNNLFTVDDDEPSLLPRRRKALYFRDSQILLLKMPGGPHEIAAAKFSDYFGRKLDKMGCSEEIVPTRGKTMLIDGNEKEPDASWGFFGAGNKPSYATCVLECSMSESNRALSRDARLWLEHENSRVAQVVTLQIYRRRPEIILKVWTRA